jgi:hypothetical protein
VTGGIAPNRQGKLSPFAAKLTNSLEVNDIVVGQFPHCGLEILTPLLHYEYYACR